MFMEWNLRNTSVIISKAIAASPVALALPREKDVAHSTIYGFH